MTDTGSGEKTFTQKDIDFHMAKYEAIEGELKEYKSKFKDIDPVKVKEALTELDNLKKKNAKTPEEIDALIQGKEREISERFGSRVSELESENGTLKSELKRHKVTNGILSEAANKFNADALKLIEPIIEKDGDLDNGQIVFKDKDGKVRYSKKHPDKPLSTQEYLDELVELYPSAAKPTMTQGGKNGTEKVNGGQSASGKVLSLAEIKALPDRGRAYFAELAKTDRKALEALLDNRN